MPLPAQVVRQGRLDLVFAAVPAGRQGMWQPACDPERHRVVPVQRLVDGEPHVHTGDIVGSPMHSHPDLTSIRDISSMGGRIHVE